MFSTLLDEIFIKNACLLYRLHSILFFESLACTSVVIIHSITNRGASTVVMRSDRQIHSFLAALSRNLTQSISLLFYERKLNQDRKCRKVIT